MDPRRPKQPTGAGVPPGQPALESVVRAHSDQLVKLNTELSSAFAQVTGEMGDLRISATSMSMALAALSSQVAALTDLLPARARESNPAPPAAPPGAPPPVAPPDQHLDPRWEPTLSPPNAYPVLRVPGTVLPPLHAPSLPVPDRWSLCSPCDVLADGACSRLGGGHGGTKQFLEEFRRVFDHPTQGSDAAGRLHSLRQGARNVADYTLEFRTLASLLPHRNRMACSLSPSPGAGRLSLLGHSSTRGRTSVSWMWP